MLEDVCVWIDVTVDPLESVVIIVFVFVTTITLGLVLGAVEVLEVV